MNFKSALIATTVLILSTTLAFAHSDMKTTSPKNQAKLDAAPEMLHLTFSAPARVMKVVMTHTTADGANEMRLEVPSRELVDEVHLTPEFPGAGAYRVEWRALGEDGHVMTGEFSFDVGG